MVSVYAADVGDTFVSGNITSIDNPDIFNNTDNTNTILANVTDPRNSTITGHEGDETFWDPIVDSTERLLQTGEFVVDLFTAGFIIDVMEEFDTNLGWEFPEEFKTGLQLIVGMANVFFVLYIITGRTIPTFT